MKVKPYIVCLLLGIVLLSVWMARLQAQIASNTNNVSQLFYSFNDEQSKARELQQEVGELQEELQNLKRDLDVLRHPEHEMKQSKPAPKVEAPLP